MAYLEIYHWKEKKDANNTYFWQSWLNNTLGERGPLPASLMLWRNKNIAEVKGPGLERFTTKGSFKAKVNCASDFKMSDKQVLFQVNILMRKNNVTFSLRILKKKKKEKVDVTYMIEMMNEQAY